MQRFWQKRPQWWKKLLALFNTTEKDYLISLIFIYTALFLHRYIFHDNYFYSLQNKGLHYIIFIYLLCIPLAYNFILNKILSKRNSNKKNKKDDYSEMQQAGFIALFFAPIIIIFIVIKNIKDNYLKFRQ